MIAQRGPDSMLGGLWRSPAAARARRVAPRMPAAQIRESWAPYRGRRPDRDDPPGYTHFRITLYVFTCATSAATAGRAGGGLGWSLSTTWSDTLPVTDQKNIALLRDGGGQLGMDLI